VDNRLPSYFLDIFGRPERLTPCECGRSSEPTMGQALHLMNAPEVEQKVASGPQPRGPPAPGKSQRRPRRRGAMPRRPRPVAQRKEKRSAKHLFAAAPREQAAQDFLWTLLNAYDFLFVQ